MLISLMGKKSKQNLSSLMVQYSDEDNLTNSSMQEPIDLINHLLKEDQEPQMLIKKCVLENCNKGATNGENYCSQTCAQVNQRSNFL